MGLGKQAAATIAAAMLACVSGAASAQQKQAQTATEGEVFTVLEYVFEFAHASEGLDAKFREVVGKDPAALAAVEGFRFDLPVLLHAMAERAAPQIAAEEITTCTAFVASPRGDQLLAISRSAPTFDEAIPKLEALPESEASEMAAFMLAPCTQKVLHYMDSPEVATLAAEQGQQQVCAFLMAKADADQRKRMVAAGCKG